MGRPARGSIRVRVLADGTRSFQLRFWVGGERADDTLHERPDCRCGCGGAWSEQRARAELQNVLARLQAGIWRPRPPIELPQQGLTWRFDQYATDWLARWSAGALGEDKPDDSTVRLVRDWVLRKHLLPALGSLPVDDEHFTKNRLTGYKAQLLTRHDEIAHLRAAGQVLRRTDGRPEKLSKRSIQIILRTLAQILDEAVEDGHLAAIHARSKRMRVRPLKPIRTWLQPDELGDLLTGAALIDGGAYSPTTDRVRALHEEGHRIPAIADVVSVSVPTVYYHLAKPAPDSGQVGEARTLISLLGYAGPRIGEALALRHRDVRLHAAPRRLDVLDAKTPTGVREVHLSPQLAEILVLYRDARRRDGPVANDDFLWAADNGAARSYTWALKKVKRAARIASERREARGLPPLPAVTPHTLRHTYISILLLVTDNVPYVMEQVGHDDETTTTRIYRHLIRQRQEHGAAFDRAVAQARAGFGAIADRDGFRA
jgi:integrase